ncbi:MAG: NAD(P)H-binding protein [Xanthobacteraceae bacterium]|nr:NAD(P)H-binding protein [Xanthobacteraceae bacterium]
MKVIIFGATGMVGQGVLRECLRDGGVALVLAVGRGPTGQVHPKLREITHGDFFDFSAIAPNLAGYDACFFCLGVSVAGMSEAAYRRITHDITLAAAETLARQNPAMTFVYVTGAGTDSSERGRVMWARIKGATENALLRLPFRSAYMFRPGMIQPLGGVRSKTPWVQAIYSVLGPVLGLLRTAFPNQIVTTEQVGRAMIAVVRTQPAQRIVGAADINRLAASQP